MTPSAVFIKPVMGQGQNANQNEPKRKAPIRKRQFPVGARRAIGLEPEVVITAKKALPKFAPSTIQSDGAGPTTPAATVPAVIITTAREEKHTSAITIPTPMAIRGQFVSCSKMPKSSGICLSGAVVVEIMLSAIITKASPRRIMPNCPMAVRSFLR